MPMDVGTGGRAHYSTRAVSAARRHKIPHNQFLQTLSSQSVYDCQIHSIFLQAHFSQSTTRKHKTLLLRPGRGNRGHVPSHSSKTRARCPFSCNLVALLETFENAKINRKTYASSDFRRSKFQNSLWGARHRTPLQVYMVLSPRLSATSHFQKPCQGPLNPSPPLL